MDFSAKGGFLSQRITRWRGAAGPSAAPYNRTKTIPPSTFKGTGRYDSLAGMADGSDIDALRAALAAAGARAANAEAQVSDVEAQIAAMKLMIEKLRRAPFCQRSERKQRLLDQQELRLDELEASATEDELTAE